MTTLITLLMSTTHNKDIKYMDRELSLGLSYDIYSACLAATCYQSLEEK
jgi:hypothetical protein